ncbi:MAG TPA: hypothetical protein VMI94_09565 [Bryobacteraceae bacterium]|nr:hypothetical protein [Bryobacteraceae bacterium]
MRILIILTATTVWLLAGAARAQPAAGIFEAHSDVGTVLHPGTTAYDPTGGAYTISGSGENMWFASDAFQFAWKKMSGDVTLTADIAFIGAGGEAHRKAVLMIRQSLDADSAYADVARHGDGLTSLQARDEKGADTAEIQSAMKAPARVRIARRGDYFYFWVAAEGEPLRFAGGSMRVPMHDPFYVGLGVCSHNKDSVERAVFNNVELSAAPPKSRPELYSTLEVVPLSGDRRVVYVTRGRIENPEWSEDGAALIFYRGARRERVPLVGGTPEAVPDSVPARTLELNVEAANSARPRRFGERRSPDGRQTAFLTSGGDYVDTMLQVEPAAEKQAKTLAKLVGGRGTISFPWSPDSRRLVFISYQHVSE